MAGGLPRRELLRVLAAGAARAAVPAGVMGACAGPGDAGEGGAGGEEPPTPQGPEPVDRGPTAVGDASGWLPGNFGAVDGTRIAVGRDEAGFWALSLTCTHLACNIAHEGSVDWNGIRCACHGSRFGRDGDVVFGPAVRDLRNYAVSIGEDGQLIVDTASDVPLGTRTPGESA